MRASHARRGLLVLVAGICSLVAKPVGSQTKASIPQGRAHHCRRWLRLILGDVPRGAGVSSARFFLGAGSFLTEVHGGTRRCASPFCLPSFEKLRQASQNGASDAPDAFAAAALAALIDAARDVPRDDGIRHSTQTWYHHHHTRATFVTQGSLGHDEHALPSRAFLAPAPSRAAAHLVITRKETRCTRCQLQNKETIKFVNPTRNKIVGSRNMKTCRRQAGGNFHLRAAVDLVEILTVFSGEDAMQWTALLPAQERLLAGDAQLRLNPRLAIRETTCCASTPSSSRFNAAVDDATDSLSDCEVGSREPAQEDAAAMATEGVEDWPESEQKGLFRCATGSRCPCLLPCQCVRVRARARVCVRVFSSGPKFQKFF